MPTSAQESPRKKSQFEKRQERKLKKQMNKSRKGDQAKSNRAKLREVNYKARTRQGDRAQTTDPAGRRVRTIGTDSSPTKGRAVYSQPNPYAGRRLQKTDRAASTNRRIYSSAPRNTQRAWTGDIAGRRLSAVRSSTSTQQRFASNQAELNRLRSLQSQPRPGGSAKRITPRSSTASASKSNVFSQRESFVRNPSTKPRSTENAASNKSTIARLKGLQSQPTPTTVRKITPRSSSASFIVRRNPNPYLGKYSKGEKAFTRDVAGRPLRQRNYESPTKDFIPSPEPYAGRKKMGDKAYSGSMQSGYKSATRSTPRAWQGDIAGRKIRRINPRDPQVAGSTMYSRKPGSVSKTGDQPYQGNLSGVGAGSISGSWNNRGNAIAVKKPSKSAARVDIYRGNMRSSPRSFTDQGGAYSGNIKVKQSSKTARVDTYSGDMRSSPRSFTDQGGAYSGNIKVRKSSKTARVDTYSGDMRSSPRSFTDQGGAYSGNIKVKQSSKTARVDTYSGDMRSSPRSFTDQGGAYTGNIKVKKSSKTARVDTYSGDMRSSPRSFTDQGGEYTGNIKVKKTSKTARVDTYRGDIRSSSSVTDQGGSYSGNIKVKKPQQGGGSISGSWNNDGKAIASKKPSKNSLQAGKFSGNSKTTDFKPSVRNQGGDFAGNIKVKKPVTDDPAARWQGDHKHQELTPSTNKSYYFYSGTLKQPSYVKQPNSADGALKVMKPNKSIKKFDDLQVKTKLPSNYARKPHASSDALKGIQASKYQKDGSVYKGYMTQPKYVANPNSHKEALRVVAPSKVTYRMADYQGNMKMQRNKTANLHPDARFAHSGKSNTPEGRDTVTGIKLMWAKLFQKNSTVPNHLKEKVQRPRYDKKEIGLWYE